MKRIFIDTNVIIDVLMRREGFLASAKVLALAKKDNVSLFVSVLTMANIAYILRKTLKGDAFYQEITKIASLLYVMDITTEHFQLAIKLRAKDFEDALQYYCVMSNSCDVIVTRNKKDFNFSEVNVMTPEEILS